MNIDHAPTLAARELREGDLETFEKLEPGDEVKFFEWPVEPLTVLSLEEIETVGRCVRVEAEGSESFLYEFDDHLWHYAPDQPSSDETNPYPVQNLVRVESTEA
jgi:hypothetical protein